MPDVSLKIKDLRLVDELRDQLVGDTRGAAGAFKLALGEAIHYWRINFAPLHFQTGAAQRYNQAGVHWDIRYNRKKPHGGGTVGSGQRTVDDLIAALGTSIYSVKMARQYMAGFPVDNRPMVYSGNTERGILKGPFRVSGTSKVVRGRWSSPIIQWRAFSAHGGIMRRRMLTVSEPEWRHLSKLIEHTYYPHYLAMVQKRQRLPKLSDLPILAT